MGYFYTVFLNIFHSTHPIDIFNNSRLPPPHFKKVDDFLYIYIFVLVYNKKTVGAVIINN
jgi:hypothetical protein